VAPVPDKKLAHAFLFDGGPWVDDAHPAHRYRQAFSAVLN
jgi:hypothetical protein